MTIPRQTNRARSASSFHPNIVTLTSLSQDIPASEKSELLHDWSEPTQWLEGISDEIIDDSQPHSRHSDGNHYWDSLNRTWVRHSCMYIRRCITALAVILCQTGKPEDEIACAVEQYCRGIRRDNRGVTYVIRVARAGGVEGKSLYEFQMLIDKAVEDMLGIDRTKDGTKSSKDRRAEIWSFEERLLQHIVQRCKEKILNFNYKQFQKWAQKTFCTDDNETGAPSAEYKEWIQATKDLPEDIRTTCEGLFKEMSTYVESNKPEHMVFCIEAVSYMMARLCHFKSKNPGNVGGIYDDKDRLPGVLEIIDKMWKAAEESDLSCEGGNGAGDNEQIEGFVASDARRSHIYRYLESLRRYRTASNRITASLLQLHDKKKLYKGSIIVKRVENFASISAKEENDYKTLRSFITSFGDDYLRYESLDRRKISNIKQIWKECHEVKRYVHPEIQLMLFYALRPRLVPASNFIAVSGLTCLLCSKAIKYFARLSEGTSKLKIHAAMAFAFAGTNGEISTNWQFPRIFSQHERNVTGGLGDRAFNRCRNPRCECPNITCWGLTQLENWLKYFKTTLQNDLRIATRAVLRTAMTRNGMGVVQSNNSSAMRKRKRIPGEQIRVSG